MMILEHLKQPFGHFEKFRKEYILWCKRVRVLNILKIFIGDNVARKQCYNMLFENKKDINTPTPPVHILNWSDLHKTPTKEKDDPSSKERIPSFIGF
jgi:hypothetical protein